MKRDPRESAAAKGRETDESVMSRAARGDDGAFGDIVTRHHRTVLNFVHRFLGMTPDAEDLCHDVFLRIYRSRSAYEPTARFTTFLYRTTLNHCLNHARAMKLRRALPLDPVPGEDGQVASLPDGKTVSPDDGILSAERARLVREAVDELPEAQRTAVLLLRWEELSYNQIAEVMGLSIMAVKSLLSRAKENLREKLSQRLGPE